MKVEIETYCKDCKYYFKCVDDSNTTYISDTAVNTGICCIWGRPVSSNEFCSRNKLK